MQPHRSNALHYASAPASAAHSRVCGVCAAEAAASEASTGLRVSGCIRAPRYFVLSSVAYAYPYSVGR